MTSSTNLKERVAALKSQKAARPFLDYSLEEIERGQYEPSTEEMNAIEQAYLDVFNS